MIGPKPCPFCGSDDLRTPLGGHYSAWVVCESCDAEGPPCDSELAAIAAWNSAPRLTPAERAVLDAAVSEVQKWESLELATGNHKLRLSRLELAMEAYARERRAGGNDG